MEKIHFEPYARTGSSAKDEQCYVCRQPSSVSIRALTESEDDAMRVAHMFNYTLGLHVTLVPNKGIPEVQLAACLDHIKNLHKLEDEHKETKLISLASIVRSLI